MSKGEQTMYLTNRDKQQLIQYTNQCIDTLKEQMSIFTTITYESNVRFNKRPFTDNYLDVYNDNRMLKQLINSEFYRNPTRSKIQYFFVVEKHRETPRLHIHFLMSLPDPDFVRDKYKCMQRFLPFDSLEQVLEKSIKKIKRFGVYDITRIYDVHNLQSYVTKEIRYLSNPNCIDFQNSSFHGLPNHAKQQYKTDMSLRGPNDMARSIDSTDLKPQPETSFAAKNWQGNFPHEIL